MPITSKRFAFAITLMLSVTTSVGTCKLTSNKLINDLIVLNKITRIKLTPNKNDDKATYCLIESWPSNTLTTAKLVSIAYQHHIPIRTDNDIIKTNNDTPTLIVHLSNLNNVEFNRIGQIKAGSGIPISTLEKVVKLNTGYLLPISTPIHSNTTTANLIASGEFGEYAHLYGGPWEHITKITLVTANGEIKQITKKNRVFDWLFGSMNQLGIITEVDINLLRSKNANFRYPLNTKARVVIKNNQSIKHTPDESRCVLALLIQPTQLKDAQNDIYRINEQYPNALKQQEMILFKTVYISHMPPLIYNKKQSFIGIGFQGIQNESPENQEDLIKVNNLLNKVATSRNYVKYTRSCLINTSISPKSNMNANSIVEFNSIKKTLDPLSLFS